MELNDVVKKLTATSERGTGHPHFMFQQTELQEVTAQEDFVPCIFNLGQIRSFEVELGAMTIRMVIPLTKVNL